MTYTGSITGLSPNINKAESVDGHFHYFTTSTVVLEIIAPEKIYLTLTYYELSYKTIWCLQTSNDSYKLKVESDDGKKHVVIIEIFKNEKGILVNGQWKEGGRMYELWGKLQEKK